jgi:hypothetical protein
MDSKRRSQNRFSHLAGATVALFAAVRCSAFGTAAGLRNRGTCFGLPTLLAVLLLATAAQADEQITLTPAAGDLTAPGFAVPIRLQVTNASSDPLTGVTLEGNQLFRYELAATIPAGQTRTVTVAPWYFDGRMAFTRPEATLTPRRLPDDVVLLLLDAESVTGEQVVGQLAAVARHYFPDEKDAAAAIKRLRTRPARLDAETVSLCRDSAASGAIVSADHAGLQSLREAARRAGLDLWTIAADGAPMLVESVPRSLWKLAGRRPGVATSPHVRPDLFDLSDDDAASRIPRRLFRIFATRWSDADRLRLLLPVGVAIAALLCLAMLGATWPRRVKVIAALAVSLLAVVWVLVAVGQTDRVFVETVTVTVCDAPSGRALTRHFAVATALTRDRLAIDFNDPKGSMPRPLVAFEIDRPIYEGVRLVRDIERRWSARDVPIAPGGMAALASTRWSSGDFPIQMQSGRSRVRLESRKGLADAYLYCGGRAQRMSSLGGGLYGTDTKAALVDALIYDDGLAPTDPFRRRAMRWVARVVPRKAHDVLFGWTDEATPIEAPGKKLIDHGHLVIWMIPRDG